MVLWDAYIRDAEACLLVYSITSRSSFENIMTHFYRVQESKKALNPGPQGSIPVMLVGNKRDMDGHREVSREEGVALARELGCELIEVSAKTNSNVDKAMKDILRVLQRQQPPAPTQRTITNGSFYVRTKPRERMLKFRIFVAWLLERLGQAASRPTKSFRLFRRRTGMKPGNGCAEEEGASSPPKHLDSIGDKVRRIEVSEADSLSSGKSGRHLSYDSGSTAVCVY